MKKRYIISILFAIVIIAAIVFNNISNDLQNGSYTCMYQSEDKKLKINYKLDLDGNSYKLFKDSKLYLEGSVDKTQDKYYLIALKDKYIPLTIENGKPILYFNIESGILEIFDDKADDNETKIYKACIFER